MKTYLNVSRISIMVGATLALLSAGPLAGQTIPNPSFEADTFTVFPGYVSGNAPITGWTGNNNDRVGINPSGGSPFADNGTIPDGSKVAFIQSDAATMGGVTLSTTISGLVGGQTYKVSFRCNARGGQVPILKVEIDSTSILGATVASVGGSNPYKYCVFDFTATDVTHQLTLRNDAGGDNTVCVDDFQIAVRNSGWSYAAWTSDADSGVDGTKTYTHAFNFGSSANAVINGITFTGRAGANPSQAGLFSTANLPNVFANDGNNLSAGGSRTMANDFCYGPGGNTVVETLNINGLLPGGEYIASIYSVGWEDGPVRAATFRVGNDRLTVNQDHFGNNNGIRVSYHFTAASDSVPVIYEPLQGATFHTYGFSVQQVSIPSKPSIAQHPRSQCVGVGDTVTFTVVAGGSQPLSYQWRKGTDELMGETNPTLTLANVANSSAGGYSVVVSNNAGSVTSLVATLAVGIAIVNPSFEADSFANFPGYVSGNGPITGWTALGGHGINPGTTFSPFADNGAIPDGTKVAFMQQDGALSQTLNGFTLGTDYYVVYYENARSGAAAGIEVRVGGNTVVPAHLRAPVGGGNPYVKVVSDVFTATSTSLELSFVKSNPLGGDTTALIDYVCVLELPPNTPPTITRAPQPQIASSGETVSFQVGAFGSQPLSYRWYKGNDLIIGEDGPTLTLSLVTKENEGLYKAVVSNSAGEATSIPVSLTIFEAIPDLYNTGVQADRSVLPDGAVDPHYTFVTNPDGPATESIVQDSLSFPIVAGPWVANTSVSKWIGPRLNTAAAAGGTYVYRTTIDLTDRDPSTVIIIGRWSTDNPGHDILVNGVSTHNQESPDFTGYTPFAIATSNATFVAGINTIDFVVENLGLGYTGLRVEIVRSNVRIPPGIPPTVTGQPQGKTATVGDVVSFGVSATGSPTLTYQWKKDGVELPGKIQATLTLTDVVETDSGLYTVDVINDFGTATSQAASLCVCIKRLAGVIFGTGVDETGAPAVNGSADLHYILAQSVDPDFQGPEAFVVNDQQFPISTGNWVASGPKSKWIAPQTDQAVGNLEGDYIFQTFFDLTGYDPAQVRLVGRWAVDNTGKDILVNGVSTGIMSPGFGSFTPFTIGSGLQAGFNQLDFLMNNAPAGTNPTGLRVDIEAQVTIPTSSLTCPTGIVAECAGGLTLVTFNASAVDVSGVAVPVVCVPPSGSGFRLGVSNVVCYATDRFGGSNSCEFTVTVADTTPPGVTCPPNQTVAANTPQVVNYVASATDPCGLASFGCSPPSGSTFPVGTTTVLCTAVDGAGNPNSCTFTVHVGNECPTANPQSISVAVGGQANIQLTGSDPDGNALTFIITQPPAHGVVVLQIQTGAATYSPGAGYTGPDGFAFTVSDGVCVSPAATVSITVRTANELPVCAAQISCTLTLPNDPNSYLISLDGLSACTILDGSQSSDPDGDALAFSWFVDGGATPVGTGPVVTNCFELGCHTVALVVKDAREGSCTTNIDLCVISAAEAVARCISLVDGASLSRRTKHPLIAGLKAAAASFDKGDLLPGIKGLEAFQKKVAALLGRTNPSDAEVFIDCAQRILDAIDCVAVLGSNGVGGHGDDAQ